MLLYNRVLPTEDPQDPTHTFMENTAWIYMSVLSLSFQSERVHKPVTVDERGDGICSRRERIPSKSGFGNGGLPAGSKPPLQTGAFARSVVNGGLSGTPGTQGWV